MALVSSLIGCTSEAASPFSAPGETGPVTIASTRVSCLGYNGLPSHNPADRVAAGWFATPDKAPVQVARGSDVDWGLDPHQNRTWQLWLHSLEWLGSLIRRYEKSRNRADLDLVAAVVRDWLNDNADNKGFDTRRKKAIREGTKFRLILMTCLRGHYQAPWLDRAMSDHAQWLADPDNYSGPWNHGTDESMTLLAAACAMGHRKYGDVGYQRLLDSVFDPPKGLRPALDTDGAHNEQSAHYAVYNRSRWAKAIRVMRTCGRRVPRELVRRHRLLDTFIAYQTTPDGELIPIGESLAAKAPALQRPDQRARVYRAGYVMGRSFWGATTDAPSGRRAAAYTARFGPRRYAHGQNDHMAITWYAQGRNIIVPSGHIGYNDPKWRRWFGSPKAHNTLVVDGAPFRSDVPTALTGHRFHRTGDRMAFADNAYKGTLRERSAIVTFGPDVLAVHDRARSSTPRTVRQLWHLPPEFTAVPTPYGAVATSGRTRVHFLRVPLPGAPAPLPVQVDKGSLDPSQGWVASRSGRRTPAPTVSLPAHGTDARMLTLIIPGTSRTPPAVDTSVSADNTLTVKAIWPDNRLTLRLLPDGTLMR